MKKVDIIEGQIDLFNIPIQEPVKPKEKFIVEKLEIKGDKFQGIINLYKESCNRIVKRISGALLVGFEDKTMHFNSQGINEFDLSPDVGLMPGDEILIANEDRELNEMQLRELAAMDPVQYIKRKGDSNIIIPMESKTIVINPKGWVIEYEQKPLYHENEFFITEVAKENTDLVNKITKVDTNITEFETDDHVEIEYKGIKNTGKVVRVYNNGETINVAWNGQRTAFYYKCVKKIV